VKEILAETIKWLSQGQAVAWATVIKNSGSTPRQAGSRMVINSHGDIIGSVGGGKLEADTLHLVEDLLPKAGRGVLEFQLTGKDASETDMICGGDATILVESILPDDLEFVREIENEIGQENRTYMITWVQENEATFSESHLVGGSEGWLAGKLDQQITQSLEPQTLSSLGQPILFEDPKKGGRYLIEHFGPQARLILFGGGHVSLEVAWLADRLGFEILVVDDREDFANRERFPMAQKALACPMDQAIKQINFGQGSYVVILTRGHMHDMEVLAQVLERETTYVGMIGSRRKRTMIFAELKRRGVSQEDLAKVHAPIGIKMPAETPAEIAVSIAAELVSVRAEQQTTPHIKSTCCSSHDQPKPSPQVVLK
jgi:xanthine dehydrogenase accessory factor